MITLYIMCGLAFSGKSTLATAISESTGAKLIAFDKLWVEKDAEETVPQGDKGWKFIRKIGMQEIETALKQNISVVYDDSNPRFEHREEIRQIANKLGINCIVVYLNTPMEVIRKRRFSNKIVNQRQDVEPENFDKVIQDMEPPKSNEKFLEFTPDSNIMQFLKKL